MAGPVSRPVGEATLGARAARGCRESRNARGPFRLAFARASGDLRAVGQETSARFKIAVHRGRECYFARAIELPGCIARGATEVEAVENARAAIRSYLALARLAAAHRATVQLEISA